MGALTEGMIDILLPLAAVKIGDTAHIGLVMGTLSLGWFVAPAFGRLTDRRRLHRVLLAARLAFRALALLMLVGAGAAPGGGAGAVALTAMLSVEASYASLGVAGPLLSARLRRPAQAMPRGSTWPRPLPPRSPALWAAVGRRRAGATAPRR